MTKLEREARDLNARAFTKIAHLVEQDHRMEYSLDEALRLEKRERSSVHYARALVVEFVLEGFTDSRRASDLYSYAEGCRLAYILGAAAATRWPERCDALRDFLQSAVDANERAQRERIDKLTSSWTNPAAKAEAI